MTPETLALLVASDHPTECEAPPGFDRERAIHRVRALLPTLRRIAGLDLQLDDRAEDASFFCEVACYRDVSPGHAAYVILIRFSAFGELVTVNAADDVDARMVEDLIAALVEAGFRYVPADDLEEPYTGGNPHLRGQSWGIRYFDYL